MIELLTHSRMTAMKTCPWKHYLDYELFDTGIEADRESEPLRIGHAIHVGLDLMAQGKSLDGLMEIYMETPAWADPLDWSAEYAKVLVMVHHYTAPGVEVIATEQSFSLPLKLPGMKRARRGWRLAGKIDKIVKLPDGRLALMEHKTTSDGIGDSDPYWDGLRLDSQISTYYYAAPRLGYDIQAALYDVLKKPGQRIKKATPPENRKYKKDGTLYANQRDKDESPDDYYKRLDCILRDEHDNYYSCREVPRLEADIALCIAEADMARGMIVHCRKHGWPRNTGACKMPYRCQFYNLCSMGVNPEKHMAEYGTLPDGYRVSKFRHPELEDSNESESTPVRTPAAEAEAATSS